MPKARFWLKTDYKFEDIDRVTGEVRPGIPPLGIYCRDEAAYRELASNPQIKALPSYNMSLVALGGPALRLNGLTVKVASDAEIAWFEDEAEQAEIQRLGRFFADIDSGKPVEV
jgi:hypothetical protein